MSKAEHNKILEDLLEQSQLGNFREDIILMSQMMAVDFQIQLMQKLLASFSPRHQGYHGLKTQVDVAVANFEKKVY